MTEKKTLAPPLPIELSPDTMTMKALNVKIPRELISNGGQVDSLDITGPVDLVSRIALEFKAQRLSITLILI